MKHLEALSLLPRYFESGLDRETTRAFHEHLKGCSDCRDQIKLMKKFQQKKNQPAGEAPLNPGRRRSRMMRRERVGPAANSTLNAHHLSSSRKNQRKLVYQVLIAALLFFFAVRSGLIARLFQ